MFFKGLRLFALCSILNLSCGRSERADAGGKEQSYLEFSGYIWGIKTSQEPVGPGPNIFSEDHVFVDEKGRLHLRTSPDPQLTQKKGWNAGEVWLAAPLGYGTYQVNFSPVERLRWDNHTVFGLFTWESKEDETLINFNREIDFEISNWGKSDRLDLQYTVQPRHRRYKDNWHQFTVDWNQYQEILYTMTWTQERIFFRTALFDEDQGEWLLDEFEYQGVLNPTPGDARFRMNLWMFEGKSTEVPISPQGAEVIVNQFKFSPSE